MVLIVGLGNPGKKFQNTRHNIGFRVIDKIADHFQFSTFSFQSVFNARISHGEIANKKIVLAKPETFMNNSGKAVKKIIKGLKLKIKNLIVVHDDLDLPLGKIRISVNRGSAGHKGVESIIKELKTKNFVRFRIGIKSNLKLKVKIQNFVLSKFTKTEEKIIKESITKIIEAIELSLKEGIEKAMREYNK